MICMILSYPYGFTQDCGNSLALALTMELTQ